MSRPRNTDPFAPWNNPMNDSPFAPHNGIDRDNPFKPWNSPFGRTEDLTRDEKREYGIREKKRYSDDPRSWD